MLYSSAFLLISPIIYRLKILDCKKGFPFWRKNAGLWFYQPLSHGLFPASLWERVCYFKTMEVRFRFNLSLSFHLGLLIRFTDGSFVDIGGRVLHTLLYGGAGGLAVKKWVWPTLTVMKGEWRTLIFRQLSFIPNLHTLNLPVLYLKCLEYDQLRVVSG